MSDMMKELFDALPTNPKLMDAMVNCTIAKPRAYFPKIEKVIFNEGTVKDTGEVVKRDIRHAGCEIDFAGFLPMPAAAFSAKLRAEFRAVHNHAESSRRTATPFAPLV